MEGYDTWKEVDMMEGDTGELVGKKRLSSWGSSWPFFSSWLFPCRQPSEPRTIGSFAWLSFRRKLYSYSESIRIICLGL